MARPLSFLTRPTVQASIHVLWTAIALVSCCCAGKQWNVTPESQSRETEGADKLPQSWIQHFSCFFLKKKQKKKNFEVWTQLFYFATWNTFQARVLGFRAAGKAGDHWMCDRELGPAAVRVESKGAEHASVSRGHAALLVQRNVSFLSPRYWCAKLCEGMSFIAPNLYPRVLICVNQILLKWECMCPHSTDVSWMSDVSCWSEQCFRSLSPKALFGSLHVYFLAIILGLFVFSLVCRDVPRVELPRSRTGNLTQEMCVVV